MTAPADQHHEIAAVPLVAVLVVFAGFTVAAASQRPDPVPATLHPELAATAPAHPTPTPIPTAAPAPARTASPATTTPPPRTRSVTVTVTATRTAAPAPTRRARAARTAGRTHCAQGTDNLRRILEGRPCP